MARPPPPSNRKQTTSSGKEATCQENNEKPLKQQQDKPASSRLAHQPAAAAATIHVTRHPLDTVLMASSYAVRYDTDSANLAKHMHMPPPRHPLRRAGGGHISDSTSQADSAKLMMSQCYKLQKSRALNCRPVHICCRRLNDNLKQISCRQWPPCRPGRKQATELVNRCPAYSPAQCSCCV